MNWLCMIGWHKWIQKQYDNMSQKGLWGKFCKNCNREHPDNYLDCQG